MAIAKGGGILPVAEERGSEGIPVVTQKSSRENGSDARDMVTREKRAPKLRGNGGTKPTEVDASIELYAVTLQRHEICGGRLIKVNLLN